MLLTPWSQGWGVRDLRLSAIAEDEQKRTVESGELRAGVTIEPRVIQMDGKLDAGRRMTLKALTCCFFNVSE